MFKGTDLVIQASMYVEHRARLGILKAAVDYVYDHGGTVPWMDVDAISLPSSFLSGLKQLAQMPHYWLFPAFWQHFMWGWGGFILTDNKDAEYAALASESGLDVEDVPYALEAFDLLFSNASRLGFASEQC